jgi:hypothetical protein
VPKLYASVRKMKGKFVFCGRRAAMRLLTAGSLAAAALALIAASAERVHLVPQFEPGETLYYQIEMHTTSTGKTTSPIINPEGGTQYSENVDLLVRLDVLPGATAPHDPGKSPGSGAAAVHLRVTYERARADSQSDAPAFDAPPANREYDRLAGHSFEFTLEPGGAISDFQDLENILPKSTDAAPALSWMKTLGSSIKFPRGGIAIGQMWTSEKPLSGAPLAGLVWREDATYLRNEPCRPTAPGSDSRKTARNQVPQCAVILTRFSIERHGPAHADQTPRDYVRHGLRTEGTLTGSGESLDSISLASGLLVSSTQSSKQYADFDILDAANGEKIHRAGQVQTQTVITRVPAPPAAAAAQP